MTPGTEADTWTALSAYAQGLFPMDDPAAQDRPLPFYMADPRTILDIDPDGLARIRRKVRRSVARDPGWEPAVDRDFAAVLEGCAASRPDQGVWLTPRLASLYERMHATGFAHSWELWDGDELVAGVLGIGMRRAAMLESMFHRRPHAGNVGLLRTVERLVADGYELCDLQLATPHTTRLGARSVPAAEYERLLEHALREKVGPPSL